MPSFNSRHRVGHVSNIVFLTVSGTLNEHTKFVNFCDKPNISEIPAHRQWIFMRNNEITSFYPWFQPTFSA